MLTLAALRQHLAAALDVPEANIGAMLGGLALGGFLPFAEDALVDAPGVTAVILAPVANVESERAATEALLLGGFLMSGTTEFRATEDGATIWRATPWPQQYGTLVTAFTGCMIGLLRRMLCASPRYHNAYAYSGHLTATSS
jgi:hypothetical protein